MSSFGARLEAAREGRGVSLEEAAAATRIRRRHLVALEGDNPGDLPPPAYTRGYLRTYANFLDLEPAGLIADYEATVGRGGRNLALRPLAGINGPSTLVLTAPLAGAVGLILLVAAFTGYIYRELDSVRVIAPTPRPVATALPVPSPTSTAVVAPVVSPPVQRQVSLVVTATDTVWIDVQVDGKPQFGDAGRVLAAGTALTFTGAQRVRLTSGKASATQVNVNGRDLGPLGSGVVTREFTPQT